MRTKQIANKFLKNQNEEKATNYLKNENLYDLLIDLSNETPNNYPPDFRDLARLHYLIRFRKVFTILEFGVGYSTIIMADAIKKNKKTGKI